MHIHEASAEGPSRHCDELTERHVGELAQALVRHLRSPLDGHGIAPGTFDLVDAIDPVVAGGRASGWTCTCRRRKASRSSTGETAQGTSCRARWGMGAGGASFVLRFGGAR